MQSEIAEAVAAKLGGYTGMIVAADRDAAKRKRPQDLTPTTSTCSASRPSTA